MNAPNPAENLKKILDLCDRLFWIKLHSEEESDPSEAAQIVKEIQGRMEAEARAGSLAPNLQGLSLEPMAWGIVAVLLAQHLDPEKPELSGREILEILCEGSFAKLQMVAFLQPGGSLRELFLVRAHTKEKKHDPLDTIFQLAPKVAGIFYAAGLEKKILPSSKTPKIYNNNREFLLDLKALKSLFQQRAARLFDPEPVEAVSPAEIRNLDRKIHLLRERIVESLSGTPKAAQFAAIQFQEKYSLNEMEMLIVIGLLFQELLEGEAFADVVQLIKLVSAHEEDLILHRALFKPNAPLIRHHILEFEDMVEGKETTAQVVLSNWVVEALLEEGKEIHTIGADEKIDFYKYLKNLDSSEKFLRDLSEGGRR